MGTYSVKRYKVCVRIVIHVNNASKQSVKTCICTKYGMLLIFIHFICLHYFIIINIFMLIN